LKITYLLLPDGDKLISYHRHDFKSKEINGDFFAIDGGRDYTKLTGDMSKCKIIDCELEEIFDFIRNDNTLFNHSLLLKDISTKNLLEYTDGNIISNLNKELFLLELKHRDELKRNKKE